MKSMADRTLRELGTAGLARKARIQRDRDEQIKQVARARARAQALPPWAGYSAEVQRVWGSGVSMAAGAAGYSRSLARERRRAQARVLKDGSRKTTIALESWSYASMSEIRARARADVWAAVVGHFTPRFDLSTLARWARAGWAPFMRRAELIAARVCAVSGVALGPDWLPGDAVVRLPGDALCCASGSGRREWGLLVRVPASRGKRQGRSPVMMVSLGAGERYEYIGGAIRSDTVEFSIFLARLGHRVSRRSRGVRVSSTSIEDSASAARAAVVGHFTPRFDLSTLARWARAGWAPFMRRAELIAARAASASLGEGAGLSGRNEGKRLAWCSSLDAGEQEFTGGQYLLRLVTLQLQRQAEDAERWEDRFDGRRAMARGLSSVVRRARRAALAGVLRVQDRRPVSRRFRRLHRVLSRVALGESLELACETSGFAWEHGHGRSKALSVALESSGVLRKARLALGRAGVSLPDAAPSGGIGVSVGLSVRPAGKPDRRPPYRSGGDGLGVSVPAGASIAMMRLAARYARQRRANSYVEWWRSVPLGK
jgi:hypothetical protein